VKIDGTHVESLEPLRLTGRVTVARGSTAVGGTGTRFRSQVRAGQYVKLDADPATAWMRVESIAADDAMTLSEQYQGIGGAGNASLGAGDIRIVNGSGLAQRNLVLNPYLTVAAGLVPGVYLQSGADNRLEFAGDAALPVIIGANASRTYVGGTVL